MIPMARDDPAVPGPAFLLAALVLQAAQWSQRSALRVCSLLPTGRREPADQPIRLQRIVEPWFGPSSLETATDHGGIDLLPIEVEQRELPARLRQPPPQIENIM
jgi:hypothetical protein